MSRDEAQFDQEKEMLVTFSGNANPHLISLLATYEQYNEYYLIFPWAEGDLQSFWRDLDPKPSMTHDSVLWVAEQCFGVAKGLLAIHRHQTVNLTRHKSAFAGHQAIPCPENQVWPLFGVHGDIKPQNVLWFQDDLRDDKRGILKISDFGLAEFKTSTTKIYRPSSQVALSASYRPPECESKNGRIGQSQDIWALGCLYLEMVAWLLGGWQLVQEFQQRRASGEGFSYYGHAADTAFFQIESVSKDGTAFVMVKPAVTEFIDYLRSIPTCTEYIHSFLHLIQTEMLILKPTNQRERGRIGAIELVSKLNRMWQNCQDTEFATTSVGWL
ncbi:hypothetical protein INS49_004488 [Diaporthe citri]|uniref:uncharacterized protein n=1 Tax=Diaporthe citri TaxID=83186 RepID=UPI001C7E3F15|nr:uncharacterized protein INS49_004488 [Diaporthe citri]KAG6354471.1 hypothetical protein INS49_004488 [Diaporthe citri]